MGLSDSVRSLFKQRSRKTRAEAQSVAAPLPDIFAREPNASGPKGASALPSFKATAADQIDRRRADRFTTMRMKLRNAFTPSQPILDRHMFAGRTEVLSGMIGSIEDQRLHLVIYGERGIGKTSLLHMLADAARDARYIVVYSSCGAASNFQETFRSAAAEIPLLFHSSFAPTTEEAETGSTLADLLPESFSPRQFADLCVKLTGTRALIMLDEFDRCGSADFRRDLAELIKFLSDRSVRVQLVIGGVAADLSDLIEHIPSIRRNILAVRVPRMTDDEVRAMVASGERASGLAFDPAARDFIVRLSRGWPYIACLLCHHSGLHALDSSRTAVLAEDVAAALDESLAELRTRMSKNVLMQIERLTSEGVGAKLLTAIAGISLSAGGEFGSFDIEVAPLKAAETANAKRYAEQLANERVLLERRDDTKGGHYGFVEDGLAPYLWFLGAQRDYQDSLQKAPRASNG